MSVAVDQRIEMHCFVFFCYLFINLFVVAASHAQALPAETLKVTLVFLVMKYSSTISNNDHKLQRNSRNLGS